MDTFFHTTKATIAQITSKGMVIPRMRASLLSLVGFDVVVGLCVVGVVFGLPLIVSVDVVVEK